MAEVSGSPARPSDPLLALDLGGTNARAAVVLPGGRLTARAAGATPMADGAGAVTSFCSDLLQRVRDEHLRSGGAAPVALGISAPGPLDATAGALIDPPNLRGDWRGFDLGPQLGRAVGLPWAMERDTNVSILAERDFGAGRGYDDLVYLTISTGVGGAVISDGRLLRGPDGVAGELGHLTVDLEGPPCNCGARGHLEAIASGTGIARAAREALAAGAEAPELSRLAGERSPAQLGASDVSAAADLGDPVAGVILERARRAVAVTVVSIVDVFGPDVVILGGGITLAWGERLMAPIREAVAETAFRTQGARAQVVQAALGDDVGLIGTVPLVASALPRFVADDEHR